MDMMEHAARKKIRQHPAALRHQVLTECEQPGAAVARVAQSHGLNANMVHARRCFEELSRGGHSASAVVTEAMRRWARIYHAAAAFAEMDHDSRRQVRQKLSKPLWGEFKVWLKLQRTQVLDGT
jgi:transposase-like protein